MSIVLVVQPDAAQVDVIRQVLRRVGAELVLAESTAAAVEAIDRRVPDLILLSAWLSPRDEDGLMAHLRFLDGTSHLQTLTIPQFSAGPRTRGSKVFSFRKKRPEPVAVGCDPAVFTEEIVAHLDRAAEIRNRSGAPAAIRTVIQPPADAVEPAEAEVLAESDDASIEIVPADEDEIEELVRKFGLDVTLVQIHEGHEGSHEEHEDRYRGQGHEDERHEGHEDRYGRQAHEEDEAAIEEDATLAAALDRARADAEERRFVELARVQAEAEVMRDTAIAEARGIAEREARETLAVELARVRAEAEGALVDALNKVKVEAEESERLRTEAQQAFAEELTRVRAEVEQTLATQLDTARAEAERVRAAEADVARMRAEAGAQLKSELERIRQEAERARQAEQSKASRATEQIREAAAVEARAIAEAEIARVRSNADTLLETELARVRAEAERRQRDELDELRAQMAEMREAAAQHARTAAADAVASAIRKEPRTAVIARFPTGEVESPEDAAPQRPDYYSLWQPKTEPAHDAETTDDRERDAPTTIASVRRHAKWALPTAACLLLVTNTGTAISTVARFVTPVERPMAAPFVEEKEPPPPAVTVPERKVGELKVESTPFGADVLVDGRRYGQTPLTIAELPAGGHTLTLKSEAGTITRRITIRANESVVASEAIFSGWLAIFSPIAVDLLVDGQPVVPTDDGRIMIAPGRHQIEMASERFNYRSLETLEVRPGEVTPHTVVLPSVDVHLDVPDGMEIRVDGEVVGPSPLGGLSLPIGTHEIWATHPELGERRASVDVRFGELVQVVLQAGP